MRLLVLAQTPPPLHGQSRMVRALIEGLPSRGIEVHHVELRLSSDHSDIGRWRPGKALSTLLAALRARRMARRLSCDALYYVPAPAKRGALYRDLVALAICRIRGTRLVLHWHAPGLGAWLGGGATRLERFAALRILGGADLSIVLSPGLRKDAEHLRPARVAVVPNGIVDPGTAGPGPSGPRFEVLFLGLGSPEKGLFDTLEALELLEARNPGAFRLRFAGNFPSSDAARRFKERSAALGDAVKSVGFADDAAARELLSTSHLFCLPTRYPGEGQPLALLEAMAHDLQIVTTRWRGIPDTLPPGNVWFVEPGNPAQIASAIALAAAGPRPGGAMRRHYLQHFTVERHLDLLAETLRTLGC